MAERIDSHHHLWKYNAADYCWIDDASRQLRRDFLLPELEDALRSGGMQGAITVQTQQDMWETWWLLGLAQSSPLIRGVVAWAPIASGDFEAHLPRLKEFPKLKGLRHVIQAEPDDDFILRADFNRGIDRMLSTGLVYDILIYERHLPQTIKFVDGHPEQVFVLDHVAKPRIREWHFEPWNRNIRALAQRPNVYCKVSGMVTEADWAGWTDQQLRPYWETVLEAFTPQRLMFGSDWPVCLVASTYARWCQTVEGWASGLSDDERARFFGGTATEVYQLS